MKEECTAIGELEGWLRENGHSQAWLARLLGVSAPSVNAWFGRTSRPGTHHRDVIEEATGGAVPRDHWLLPSEVEARDKALARMRAVGPEDGPEAA